MPRAGEDDQVSRPPKPRPDGLDLMVQHPRIVLAGEDEVGAWMLSAKSAGFIGAPLSSRTVPGTV